MMSMHCLHPAQAVGGGWFWAKDWNTHSRGSDVFIVVHVSEDLAGQAD